jgi:hypothetical protein
MIVLLVAAWLATVYLSMAILCGNWHDRFLKYAPPDPYHDDFPWFMEWAISLVPVAGIAVALIFLIGERTSVHLDWPIRAFRKEKPPAQKVSPLSIHAMIASQTAAIQAQMQANLNTLLFGVGTFGAAGSAGGAGLAGGGGGGGWAFAPPLSNPPSPKQGLITAEQYRIFTGLSPQVDDISIMFDGLRKIAVALPTMPDPEAPNTMGWRSWSFDIAAGVLRSPQIGTAWPDAELHCEEWCESDVIRGVAGIHAHLVPYGWADAPSQQPQRGTPMPNGYMATLPIVTGIVERFGKFVLGTEGWRAEWVIIRKLSAPNRAVAAALREIYPEVEIVCGNR